jgi:hypothetical protein
MPIPENGISLIWSRNANLLAATAKFYTSFLTIVSIEFERDKWDLEALEVLRLFSSSDEYTKAIKQDI